VYHWTVSRVSSSSIVSVYGLDDRAIGVRSAAEAEDISSNLCVQTGSGAHPASCTMGTGCPFPGGKSAAGRDAVHSPHLVKGSIKSRSYNSSPPSASMACSGTALYFIFYHWAVAGLPLVVRVPQFEKPWYSLYQWYSTCFVRVPPDIISLQLYTAKVVGTKCKLYIL
jgi:hypothetical protein